MELFELYFTSHFPEFLSLVAIGGTLVVTGYHLEHALNTRHTVNSIFVSFGKSHDNI